jgi:hypothetical protein
LQVGGSGFALDRENSLLESDDRMGEAFDISYDRVSPTMTDADWQAIENHSAVAYILTPPIPAKTALDISRRALLLIGALLKAGGVAAKGESSGIAHGRDRWLRLAAECTNAATTGDERSLRSALFGAWVRRPIEDEDDGVYYSCGMHLLGKRDIEVDTSLDVVTAVKCMDRLGLYLLDNKAPKPVRDGSSFKLGATDPRLVIHFCDCTRYEEDDFSFNPYGYVRLEEADESE